jgi:hypothetical protein
MANKTKQANKNNNPTGKGGFADHPENITPRKWKIEDNIPYQYNVLLRLTVNEFRLWLEDHPEDTRTMAQEIAYFMVLNARKDLKTVVEITDRTSGKAPQRMDFTTGGESINQFSDEQIIRIANRIAKRGGSDGNLSGKA